MLSGASGFIARNAAEKLKKSGFRTIGLSRCHESLPNFDAVYPGMLSRPLTGVFQDKIDSFIHCSYHSGKDDYTVNVEGTKTWAVQAEKEGVKHQIFMGSVTARAGSPSSYARAKHDLEQWFVARGHAVFRLGLVLGRGGLFQRMAGLMKRFPLLPILDGGRSLVRVSGIRDVCESLVLVLEPAVWVPGRAWNIFQDETYCLREILVEMRKQMHARCLFFPVPSSLVLFSLRFLEKVPFWRLGISSNNIIGLRHSFPQDRDSDYPHFGLTGDPLERLISLSL